jgi:hypothetical protein
VCKIVLYRYDVFNYINIRYGIYCKILCLYNLEFTVIPKEDENGIRIDKIIIITHDNTFLLCYTALSDSIFR